MKLKVLGIAAVAAFLLVGALPDTSLAQGLFPGLPTATTPLTGGETVPADTHLPGGTPPQSENISINALKNFARTPVTLTLADPVAIDSSAGEMFSITLGAPPSDGIRNIGTPTNAAYGHAISIAVVQDSSGSRTVQWPGAFQFGCGAYTNANTPPQNCASTPTLSTTASRTDVFNFIYANGAWLETGRILGLQVR